MSLNTDDEPVCKNQANNKECWVQAMNVELQALHHNITWIFVDSPTHIKPIRSMRVDKVKYKVDCTIERYKKMLIAKGYIKVE